MIFYHSSKQLIDKPIVKGSNPTNDYGPSFYLTMDKEAAKSWACKNDSLGILNKYSIKSGRFQSMRILDLTDKKKYNILNWLAILMHFRELGTSFINKNGPALKWLNKYYVDVDEYDIVIGFRADDSYFRFPVRFVTNELSFDDLEEIYLSGDLGKQYAFMSKRAIVALKFESFIECEPSFIGHYHSIVIEATQHFDELLNRPRDPKKTYIFDLMRKDDEH